jgi:hypothetical protein
MFGPHGNLQVDGLSFELVGRYLDRPLSHAEIQALNWFQVAIAFYCVWLIINILIELKFYKERGFDLKADNGKRYLAQKILSSIFPKTDMGAIKFFGQGFQLFLCLLYLGSG